jgi:hypothetical protein
MSHEVHSTRDKVAALPKTVGYSRWCAGNTRVCSGEDLVLVDNQMLKVPDRDTGCDDFFS